VDLYNKKMAQYSQDFQSKSQSLMSYIQGQLANVVSWSALPGQLNKIVTSSGGYVWGINSVGNMYTCKEPCNGQNWRGVQGPPKMAGTPLDIAVDDQNVYILYNIVPTPVVVDNSPSVQTGQIGVGDVGMPPGHIAAVPGGVLVSASFLGGNAAATAAAITSGKAYKATLTSDNGASATFTVTSVGTNPDWQGPPWMYVFSGSDGDAPTLDKKLGGSQTISITLSPTAKPAPPAAQSSALSFSMQPVDGSGSWSDPQSIPGTPPVNPTIHLTDQFIFVGTQGCSKPCTTGSWVAISQPSGGKGIVAASSGNTYALGDNNTIYQSSANGQGGWTEQSGLDGVMPLAVGADSQFILGVDQSSQRPVRCSTPYTEDGSCARDDTITYKPMAGSHTMSVNPRSYQTYVAAASSGPTGNLYQRVDPGSIDHSGALGETQQYLSGMDSDVNALGSAAENQSSQIEVAKVKQAANAVIKKVTDIKEERESTAAEREKVKRKIQTMGGPVSEWKTKVLQIIAITLAVVLLSYFGLSFLVPPVVNMSIAIAGMLVGVGFAIYFTVTKQ
jgi:hypothetical protein